MGKTKDLMEDHYNSLSEEEHQYVKSLIDNKNNELMQRMEEELELSNNKCFKNLTDAQP